MPKMKKVFKGFKKSTTDVSNFSKNDEKLLQAVEADDLKKVEEWISKKNVQPTKIDHQGHTTFHRTARKGKADVIDLFLKLKVDTNAPDVQGRTPLHDACKFNQPRIADMLLRAYNNSQSVDNYQLTPLHHACIGGSQQCVKLLLQAGAPADYFDMEGRSPLFYAGNIAICKELVEHSANVNARDNLKRTALIQAAEQGNEPVCRFLLLQSANPNLQDGQGHTAMWYAKHNKNEEIQELLKKAPTRADWNLGTEREVTDQTDGKRSAPQPPAGASAAAIAATSPEDATYENLEDVPPPGGAYEETPITAYPPEPEEGDFEAGVGVHQVEVGIVPMEEFEKEDSGTGLKEGEDPSRSQDQAPEGEYSELSMLAIEETARNRLEVEKQEEEQMEKSKRKRSDTESDTESEGIRQEEIQVIQKQEQENIAENFYEEFNEEYLRRNPDLQGALAGGVVVVQRETNVEVVYDQETIPNEQLQWELQQQQQQQQQQQSILEDQYDDSSVVPASQTLLQSEIYDTIYDDNKVVVEAPSPRQSLSSNDSDVIVSHSTSMVQHTQRRGSSHSGTSTDEGEEDPLYSNHKIAKVIVASAVNRAVEDYQKEEATVEDVELTFSTPPPPLQEKEELKIEDEVRLEAAYFADTLLESARVEPDKPVELVDAPEEWQKADDGKVVMELQPVQEQTLKADRDMQKEGIIIVHSGPGLQLSPREEVVLEEGIAVSQNPPAVVEEDIMVVEEDVAVVESGPGVQPGVDIQVYKELEEEHDAVQEELQRVNREKMILASRVQVLERQLDSQELQPMDNEQQDVEQIDQFIEKLTESQSRLEEEMERNSVLAGEVKLLQSELNDSYSKEQSDFYESKPEDGWGGSDQELFDNDSPGDKKRKVSDDDSRAQIALLRSQLLVLSQENAQLKEQVQDMALHSSEYPHERPEHPKRSRFVAKGGHVVMSDEVTSPRSPPPLLDHKFVAKGGHVILERSLSQQLDQDPALQVHEESMVQLSPPLEVRSPSELELHELAHYQELQGAHVAEMEDLKDHIERLEQRNQGLEGQVKSLETMSEELKGTVLKMEKGKQQAADARLEKLQSEIDELREVNAHLNTQLLEAPELQVEQQTELMVAQSSEPTLAKALIITSPERDNELEELRELVKALQDENNELKTQKSDEDQKLMDVIAEIEAHHKMEQEEMRDQLSRLQEENTEMDKQLVGATAVSLAGTFDREQYKQECLEEFEEAYREQAQEIMEQMEELESERDELLKRSGESDDAQRQRLLEDVHAELRDNHEAQVKLLADRVAELEDEKLMRGDRDDGSDSLLQNLQDTHVVQLKALQVRIDQQEEEKEKMCDELLAESAADKEKLLVDITTDMQATHQGELQKVKDDHQGALQNLQAEILQLQAENEEMDRKIVEVTRGQEDQLEEIQAEISKSHLAEMDKLETELQVVQMDRDRLDRELKASAATAVSLKEIDDIQKVVDQARQENAELKAQLKNKDDKLKEIEEEMEEKEDQLKEAVTKQTTLIDPSEHEALQKQYQKDTQRLKDDIKDLEEDKSGLNKKLVVVTKEMVDRSQYEKLEADQRKQSEEMQQQIEDLKRDNADLHNQVLEAPKIEEVAQLKSAPNPSQMVEFERVTEQLNAENKELYRKLKNKDDKLKEIEEEMEEKEDQLKEAVTKQTTLIDPSEHEALQKQYQKDTQRLKDDIKDLEEEKSGLNKKLVVVTKEMVDKSQYEKLEADQRKQSEEMQQQIEDLKRDNADLHNQVLEAPQIEEVAQLKSAPNPSQMVELERVMEQLNAENKELYKKFAIAEEDREALIAEKNETEEKYLELLDFRSYMEQQLSQLGANVEHTQAKVAKPEPLTECEQLEVQESLAQLQLNLEDVNQKMGAPTDWNAEMIRDCQRLQAEISQMGNHVTLLESDNEQQKEEKELLERQLQDIQKQVHEMDVIAKSELEATPIIEKEVQMVVKADLLESTPRSRSSSSRSSKEDSEMVAVIATLQEENNNLKSENRVLKADMSEIEETLQRHMDSLKDADSSRSVELEQEYKKLYEENRSMSQEMEDIVDDMEKLKSDKVKLERSAASTRKDLDSVKDQNHDLCEEMDNLNKELDSFRAESNKMTKEILMLKKAADKVEDMQLIKDENKKLRQELEEVRDNNNQAEKLVVIQPVEAENVKGLQQQNQDLQMELDSLRGQVQSQQDEPVHDLRRQHVVILKEKDRLADENAKLNRDFEQLAKLLEDKQVFKDDTPYWNMSTAEYCARVREKIKEIKEIEGVDRDRMVKENAALRNEVEHLQDVLQKATLSNGRDSKSPTEFGRRQIVVLHKDPSKADRKYQELQEERDELLQKLSSVNGGQSLREADDFKTLEKRCRKQEKDLDRHKAHLSELKRENKLLRRESRQFQENQTFGEIEKIGSENSKDIKAEKERIKAEVTRLQLELVKRSLDDSSERSDAEMEELQRQLNNLEQQIEVSDAKHREIVSTYRSHLIAAIQGRVDPDVKQALSHIIKLRESEHSRSTASSTC